MQDGNDADDCYCIIIVATKFYRNAIIDSKNSINIVKTLKYNMTIDNSHEQHSAKTKLGSDKRLYNNIPMAAIKVIINPDTTTTKTTLIVD